MRGSTIGAALPSFHKLPVRSRPPAAQTHAAIALGELHQAQARAPLSCQAIPATARLVLCLEPGARALRGGGLRALHMLGSCPPSCALLRALLPPSTALSAAAPHGCAVILRTLVHFCVITSSLRTEGGLPPCRAHELCPLEVPM